MLKCSCAHTLSCLFMYCSFASIGHADIAWSIVLSNCRQSLHLLSVSAFNIFAAQYFVCNAWSCAATISLSVSAFRSPFDSQRNVSSSLISCLWRNNPTQAWAASLLKFLDHTQTHTHPVGLLRTSDQIVAEAATYTTHNRHKRRTYMPSAGFEAAIPAINRK